VAADRYPATVADIARWSEAAGCEGILVYTDNGIVDPWLTAQLIVEQTDRLCPLVAVQSVYMHPFTTAKMVSSLAYMYGRRCYLNLVAGGYRNDLLALGDETEHDERYVRTREYGEIVRALTTAPAPVTYDGRYYRTRGLRLVPPVPAELTPGLMVSGSSAEGAATARALEAIAVKYPQPVAEEPGLAAGSGAIGMRMGIIARDTAEQAWADALRRFPEDRAGQVAFGMAMNASDSQWHRQLAELAVAAAGERDAYWLGPFQNYQAFGPYLVGDHATVAAELARYLGLGFRTFITDVPESEADLGHTATAFGAGLALWRA
jgi:alkanesulfonate monooxygenase